MRKVVELFIRKPMWANAIIILTVLFGTWSLFQLNSSFFPELDPKRIVINVVYPGASPQEMEEGVTIKVEQALEGINGIEHIQSSSSENVATINVIAFQNADMDQLLSDVENSVNSINSFPQGAEKPIITNLKSFGMSANVNFVNISCQCDMLELKQMADKVEDDLLGTEIISEVDLFGFPELEFSVEVREQDLLRYGILFDEISNAIALKNQDVTAGIIRTEQEEFIVRSRQRSTEVADIENIIVRAGVDGQVIRVKDLADVQLQFSEESYKSYLNKKRSIVFNVKKTPEQDMQAISSFVKNYVEEFNEEHDHFKMKVLFDFNGMLQDRIDLLAENGLIGLILVLVMLGLFLSIRLSAWVAFGIPFSFLGMLILGLWYGMTINMISLFGMILVVGILVDDGIVIAENIYAHFERGKTSYQAAIDGTMEVLPSVFTSVLTTMVAFSVLLFVEGMEMMAEMAFVVMACLGFSLIEAFFVLPSHLASEKVLSKSKKGTFRYKFRSFFDGIITYMRDKIFGDTLSFLLRFHVLTTFIPLVFIFVTIIMFSVGMIGATIFPEIQPDSFSVEVAFKPGEREDKTRALLFKADSVINVVNNEIAEESGDTLVSYSTVEIGNTEQLGQSGFHAGMVRVFLDAEGKSWPADSVIARVNRRLRSMDAFKLTSELYVGAQSRWGKDVQIALHSSNDEQLDEAKKFLKQEMKQLALTKNVKDNQPLGRNEILLELKPKAEMLGIGQAEISRQIRQGIFGQEAQRLIRGTDEVKIWVRYPEEDRSSIGGFENLKIKTMTGQEVPLNELADYKVERGPVSIERRDGLRDVIVDADVTNKDSILSVNKTIEDHIVPTLQSKYPDVVVDSRGQREEGEKSQNSMLAMTGIVLFVMLLIISMNFGSLYQGLLILLTIPAGIAGAIVGHGLVGIPVSMLSAFGMIALLGVLVNDSVVFLDQFNRNLKEGMETKKAVFEAAKSRFRPIVLTSVTTVAGLMPLISETSFQAQFLIPMATSIAFGILFGTFFILLFYPAAIVTSTDVRVLRKWLWNGKKPTRNEVEPALVNYRKEQKKLNAVREKPNDGEA